MKPTGEESSRPTENPNYRAKRELSRPLAVQRAAMLRPKYRFSIQETQKLAPLVLLPIPDTLFSFALKYEETGH